MKRSDLDFLNDHVPYRITSESMLNETIHICLTIGGVSAAMEARFAIKSVYVHARRNEVFFHRLVTENARIIIEQLFKELHCPNVKILYEFVKFDASLIEAKAKDVRVRINHHSGVFGISRSFMYSIFTKVDKCIIIDTDLVYGTDPYFMWSLFQHIDPPFVGMFKHGASDKTACAGVLLQNFAMMRDIHFEELYKEVIPNRCKPAKDNASEFESGFMDQTMIRGLQLQHNIFR